MYQIMLLIPESHLESVKAAIFTAGAGDFDGYDQCCWQTKGEGQYRPLAGSDPYQGQANQLEKAEEYLVWTVCKKEDKEAVVQALLQAHPYEQPAYSVIAMV